MENYCDVLQDMDFSKLYLKKQLIFFRLVDGVANHYLKSHGPMRNSEQPVFFHCRQKCGQPALSSSFDGPKPDDFTEDVWRRFSQLYASPADIELFPGGMAEGPVGGGILGPTFTCLIGTQFANLKKGDRSCNL